MEVIVFTKRRTYRGYMWKVEVAKAVVEALGLRWGRPEIVEAQDGVYIYGGGWEAWVGVPNRRWNGDVVVRVPGMCKYPEVRDGRVAAVYIRC